MNTIPNVRKYTEGHIHVLKNVARILPAIFMVLTSQVFAENGYDRIKPIFSAGFDGASLVDFPAGIIVRQTGGRIIDDGIHGKALQLNNKEYLSVDAKSVLPQSEGTIMMWVRPHWGYYDAVEDIIPVSHTIMSFRWNDGGYFAFSDGWWEIQGAPYTWIIADNQQKLHAHSQIYFKKGEWIHLACSYRFGTVNCVRLYKNGEMVDEKRQFLNKTPTPIGDLFLGTDQGTELAKNRWLDADIDELVIFDKELQAEEILSVCSKQVPDSEDRFRNWGADVLKKPYVPERNSRGMIRETRAMFDEGTGWVSASGVKKTITNIKKAGFNVYVPCVWHGKGTRYPSNLAPLEETLTLPQEDPLEQLIIEAHKAGIEVHPWFCVALRQRLFLNEYYSLLQTPSSAFDLHRPEFRKFIVDLIIDVVRRYDVDGINLDYIRTMGVCTCKHCRKEYKDKFGREIIADKAFRSENGRMETHLQQWQDEAVEAIVKEISEKGKAIRPGLVISVDGHPRPKILPPSWEGRREIKWARNGLVDVIYNMDYTKKPDFEKHDLILEEIGETAQLIMLIANYDDIYNKKVARRPDDLNRLIGYIQRKYKTGVGVYIYHMMNTLQIKAYESSCFNEKAVPFQTEKKTNK